MLFLAEIRLEGWGREYGKRRQIQCREGVMTIRMRVLWAWLTQGWAVVCSVPGFQFLGCFPSLLPCLLIVSRSALARRNGNVCLLAADKPVGGAENTMKNDCYRIANKINKYLQSYFGDNKPGTMGDKGGNGCFYREK